MIRKIEDIVIYKDPFYYIAFPSCVTLDDGSVLLSCRRALEPRYLLGPDPDESLAGRVTWVPTNAETTIPATYRAHR